MIPSPSSSSLGTSRKPRASGDDPAALGGLAGQAPVNPARAGMIPGSEDVNLLVHRKPRASGDDPFAKATLDAGKL